MSGARSTSSDSTAPLSPDHPLTHTTPTLVPVLRRTARMAVCVLPAMSLGLSASMAAMSDSTFLEDDDEEGDDEEMEESLDSDSVSEGAEDESPTTEDEDPAAGDKGLTAGDEGPGMGVESLSLGGDEAVSGVQQRAYPIVETAVGEPLGLGYEALRRQEIALGEGRMPSVFEVGQSSRVVPESKRPEIVSAFRHPTLTTWMKPEDGIVYIDVLAYPPPTPPAQTPPSPEWSSGSLPISPELELRCGGGGGGLIRDHMIRLEELSPSLFERYDRDIRELFTRSGAVGDEIFFQRYQFRSLYDTQGEHRELRLQLAEERRARLELAEVVDSMRRGQEPRGDV
ncbi:hypothetical protein Tco_0946554 [Tanacetum coccineum]